MAQTLSTLNNRVGTGQDLLLQGVRRARFLFHFKTLSTRRWLLVQWVSVPVQATGDQFDRLARSLDAVAREQSRPTLSSVIDQYQLDLTLRRTM